MLMKIKTWRRGRLMVVAASVSIAVFIGMNASQGDAKDGDAKDKEESKVEQMMLAAHKGKKDVRDAPLEIVQDEVKKESPDWDLLAKNTKPLAELGAEIKDNKGYTSRPGPYIAAVKALGDATQKKDVAGARTAVAGLMKSCAGCHKW
jgi:hypothetical protein